MPISSKNIKLIKVGEVYNNALVVSVDEERIYYRNNGCLCYCSVDTFFEKYYEKEK